MKISKSLLSVVLSVCLLLSCTVFLVQAEFATGSGTMPEDIQTTVWYDFEDGLKDWESSNTELASVTLSEEHRYGDSGQSLKLSWNTSGEVYPWARCSGLQSVTGDGFVLWAYADVECTANIRLYKVNDGWEDVNHVPVKLTAGEHIIRIPWSDIVRAGQSFTQVGYAWGVEVLCPSEVGSLYIDQVGTYRNNQPYTPSTKELPKRTNVLYNFEGSIAGWSVENGAGSVVASGERGYGLSGHSLQFSWTETGYVYPWAKCTGFVDVTGSGLAFWAYLDSAQKQTVNFRVSRWDGDKVTYAFELEPGEHIVTIPWSALKDDSTKEPVTNMTRFGSWGFELLAPGAAGSLYVDQLGTYQDKLPYTGSTLTLPENVRLDTLYDFEDNADGWVEQGGGSSVEQNDERGYGEAGHSLRFGWTEAGDVYPWAKCTDSVNVTGDGLVFWAYLDSAQKQTVNFRVNNNGWEKVTYAFELEPGEHIVTIPWSVLKKDDTKEPATVTQFNDWGFELLTPGAVGSLFIDRISTYKTVPPKPETSEVVFSITRNSGSSPIWGSGDPARSSLFTVTGDKRFSFGYLFNVNDLGSESNSSILLYNNVKGAGNIEESNLSAAADYGQLRFWIKSSTAGRKLNLTLSTGSTRGSYAEVSVDEANEWQEIVIPVSAILPTDTDESLLWTVLLTGKDIDPAFSYQSDEWFKIAGLKIYTADPEDFSDMDGVDTEKQQPADDGSYADSDVLGRINMNNPPYTGIGEYGDIRLMDIDDLGNLKQAFEWKVGAGIDQGPCNGWMLWFEEESDISVTEDGYLSFWLKSSKAGVKIAYCLADDTGRKSMVLYYTVKEADTWEEVRTRLSDIAPNGSIDPEYVQSLIIMQPYSAFGWADTNSSYSGEGYLAEGDVLRIAGGILTDGKPLSTEERVAPVDPEDPENPDGPKDPEMGEGAAVAAILLLAVSAGAVLTVGRRRR